MDKIEFTLVSPRKGGVRTQRKVDMSTAPLSPALPRITRLMALAIKLDVYLHGSDSVKRKDLARVGRVSRSRITQILNLVLLAPDLQERLLFLTPTRKGREPICESKIRQLAQEYDWELQRLRFDRILGVDRNDTGRAV